MKPLMRVLALLAVMVFGPRLQGRDWQPWAASIAWRKEDGFSYVQRVSWENEKALHWQVEWENGGVVVTGPDGVQRKAAEPFIQKEAHYFDDSGILRWKQGDWECFSVIVGTGRNGIPLSYFLVVVHDLKSHAWDLGYGRVVSEGCPDPRIARNSVAFAWRDEVRDRCLNVNHRWVFRRAGKSLEVVKDPPRYRLEYGYPAWFMFVGDGSSTDPDKAEQAGFLAISWNLAEVTQEGGTASADRNAIPKDPGKQVWRKGTGPDTWFPARGSIRFKWEDEVEVRRFAKPVEKATPRDASRLAATGEWRLVIKREGDGRFLGSMLIQRMHTD